MKNSSFQSWFHSHSALSESLQPVADILDLLHIPHTQTPAGIIKASQIWRRKPDQERWELKDLPLDTQQKNQLLSKVQDLGFAKEIKPRTNHFDYALLLGATVPRMKDRLNHLINLWQQGLRYNRLVFLVSNRTLNSRGDLMKPEQNESMPETETEGALWLYKNQNLPEAMKQVPAEYIDTPETWNGSYWRRANTRDTLKAWLKQNPDSGKALVISDQPNSLYQFEVVRQELPDDFTIELTAGKASDSVPAVLYLDALALWLHNLQK
ncbi:hypothetical protein EOPP23_11420 [Endozoicomonas sp. OPT23]|uniref:hypothetical protein n=1 Tax=Endozoicomonas sp. OPT23 TaxID=2072845 RepID=UPI00129BAB48|nr:hypothetical protein [Endozoicomonas sp. OPT23]MRI33596.1 hypothetical protein [Endozoicomonas sp. OPT23]